MYTYQDLTALRDNETKRAEFVRLVEQKHKNSEAYKTAKAAEEYYAKRNPTILKYRKMVQDVCGNIVPDLVSANYKITHGFFRQFVLQQVQYIMSNGVTFQEEGTKAKLDQDLDNKLQRMAKKAMVDSVSFGFWNYDHLEVFCFADTPKEPGFAPLPDEETGVLMAGVRYWSPTEGVNRWTLYEPDGITEYIKRKDKSEVEQMTAKRPYVSTTKAAPATGEIEITGENYSALPIIPMYANDLKESELIGVQPSIDCYDFILSGMANNVDETSAFYWTLKGTGGMDDTDLSRFVAKMRQLKAAVLDRGVEAEAHTLAVPVEANKVLLDYLKNDMYENFMLMNPDKALSGNMTATAIRLAYQAQDDKCGDFEYCIREFIGKLLALVGIKDEPSFKWNRIANQTEETQMVLLAANYLDDEAVLKHLPWLTPEEVDEILTRKDAESLARMTGPQGTDPLEE